MTVRSAEVRFYVDADVRGLGIVLAGLRNDVTYPGDRALSTQAEASAVPDHHD
jgi:hypothetical protein